MAAAVDRLDDVVAEVVDDLGGRLVTWVGGDTWFAVFAEASAAAAAALALHRRVAAERWPRALELRLRAAVHSGEAELRDGEYHGLTVHLAGRLLAAAPPGRTVVSQAARELMARLPVGAVLFDLDAALPADASPAGGRLFGLADREADRFVVQGDRAGNVAPRVVWLLCTDVEESTRLLQSSPERYRTAMDRYRRVLAEIGADFGGTLLSSVEDLAVLAMPGPAEAVGAAVAAQQTFEAAPPEMAAARVRMAIHVEQAGGPRDAALPVSTTTAVAVCRAGHGGQVLMSHAARTARGDGARRRGVVAGSGRAPAHRPRRTAPAVPAGSPRRWEPTSRRCARWTTGRTTSRCS